MTDALIPSREAAQLWGCTDKGFTARMARWGIQPVVRPATARQGGKSNWWKPSDVLKARAMARAVAARETAIQAERTAIAVDADTLRQRKALAAIRRVHAMERWRTYWQAKAEARAKRNTAKKVPR
jgi:hypothetical protein